MNKRFNLLIGVFSIIFLQAINAQATSIKVNGNTVFYSTYESDTARNAPFGTVVTSGGGANADDTTDGDPSVINTGIGEVGSWYPGVNGVTPGSGVFEKANQGGSTFTVSSKQVQVVTGARTNDGGTGILWSDPGAYQGVNYLRGVRAFAGTGNNNTYNSTWEAQANLISDILGDVVTFQTAIYVTPFTQATNSTEFLRFYAGEFNDQAGQGGGKVLFKLSVDKDGDLLNAGSATTSSAVAPVDIGLDLSLGAWHVITVSYTAGAAGYSLAVDNGTPVTGIALPTATAGSTGFFGPGAVKLISFGGGQPTSALGTVIYFDAVPEPSSASLAFLGFAAIAGIRARRRK